MLNHILHEKAIDIYEQEPGFSTVLFTRSKRYLFFPWIVYVLRKNSIPSLHVGFRTQSLNVNNLNNELLLYPPLPHIYSNSLQVCCIPTITDFWSSRFETRLGWVGEKLLRRSALKSYKNWSELKPDEVMTIFNQWCVHISLKNCLTQWH